MLTNLKSVYNFAFPICQHILKNLKIVGNNVPSRKKSEIAKQKIKTAFDKEDVPHLEIKDVPVSKYGSKNTVTLLTGGEIGQKGSDYITSIFKNINAPLHIDCLCSTDQEVVPNEFVLSIMRNGTAIHIDTTHEANTKKQSLMMNNKLDLFVSVVNCCSFKGFSSKFPDIDIAIVMQNNRGDFSKLEYEPVKGVVETLKICEKRALKRYIDFAFQYACNHCRKKITFAHKIDEIPLSDGLHLRIARKLHQQKYPNIEFEDMFINKIIKNLIMDPTRFDLICSNEKYGTFMTSVVSGICGGASLFSASELGDQHAIFKPLQTKLSITDSGPLCPYGVVTTAVNLLQHLGYCECASTLWKALMKIMITEKIKTPEFGGEYCEEEVIERLLEVLQEKVCDHVDS